MGAFTPHPRTGIRRFLNAFRWTAQGLKSAFKNEAAFRQEVVVAVILTPVACCVSSSRIESVLMVGSLLLVLIVELLNSALENAVDRMGAEHHELAGRAKDQGSAAVFVAIMLAVMTWLIILLPSPLF